MNSVRLIAAVFFVSCIVAMGCSGDKKVDSANQSNKGGAGKQPESLDPTVKDATPKMNPDKSVLIKKN